MDWNDSGIVLGTKKHGESSVILEVMTQEHGRSMGLVRGGRSRKMQPVLQPGNAVNLTWHARLEEHLGQFQVEPTHMNAARLMESQTGLFGIQTIAAHLRLLPERDKHIGLYQALLVLLENLNAPENAGELVVRFELEMLNELGFGLSLRDCALTGAQRHLAYVSPKTGRAVTKEAGAQWADRLLVLPAFLSPEATTHACDVQLLMARDLIGYFFRRHVYAPRNVKEPLWSGSLFTMRRQRPCASKRAPLKRVLGVQPSVL